MYCSAPSVLVSAKLSLDLNMSVLYGGGMNHFSLHPSISIVVRIATEENFSQDKNVFFFFLKFLYRLLHKQNSHSLHIYIYIVFIFLFLIYICIKKLSVFEINVPNCHLFQEQCCSIGENYCRMLKYLPTSESFIWFD